MSRRLCVLEGFTYERGEAAWTGEEAEPSIYWITSSVGQNRCSYMQDRIVTFFIWSAWCILCVGPGAHVGSCVVVFGSGCAI